MMGFILPGCGRTWTLSKGATLPAHWLYEPQPTNYQQSADGGGVSTPFWEELIRVIIISVLGLLRPRIVGIYGRVHGQDMDLWKGLWSGYGILFPPGTAGPWRQPKR